MRIQFYPSGKLEKKLDSLAKQQGVTKSIIVVDILHQYFGLTQNQNMSFAKLQHEVFKEVAEYINDIAVGDVFILGDASQTYRNIPMTNSGKPNTTKSQIGKAFNRLVREKVSPYNFVEQVCFPNGKHKFSTGNRAAMYIKIASCEIKDECEKDNEEYENLNYLRDELDSYGLSEEEQGELFDKFDD